MIKHYPGQKVNCAEIEKPWIKASELLLASYMKWE